VGPTVVRECSGLDADRDADLLDEIVVKSSAGCDCLGKLGSGVKVASPGDATVMRYAVQSLVPPLIGA